MFFRRLYAAMMMMMMMNDLDDDDALKYNKLSYHKQVALCIT